MLLFFYALICQLTEIRKNIQQQLVETLK